MDLAVAIVSYNTRELTLGCLGSLYRELDAAGIDAAVTVVDNASSDGSAAAIAEAYPQATLIASQENLGFARGTNLAVAQMLDQAPDYLLLLNPDTLIKPKALEYLMSFMRAAPRVAMAGAQLEYGDGSFQHSAFRFPTLLMAAFDFWTVNHRLIESRLNGRYPRALYEAGKPFLVDHPLGAAMLVNTAAWRELGALDEGYFMYCEEIDWCKRARLAGWEVACVPKARIVHFAGQSSRQFRPQMFTALWASRFRLFARYYDKTYQRRVKRIVRAGLDKLILQAQAQQSSGELSYPDLEAMLGAYAQVREITCA
ncbi:MAG: glycosyltransferase family 2 protein [Chloroflexi bacterium]|nr:glycosyltransferase family 2 protein [Chloroflexota bacterium]